MAYRGRSGGGATVATEGVLRAMAEPLDLPLVRRSQAGDVDAFCVLASRYRERIYNFIYRSLGDSVVAEDLAQDVFVKAFAGLRRFSHRASFQTWLFRIANNRVIDYTRRERRRRAAFAFSLDACPEDTEEACEIAIPDDRSEPSRSVENKELGREIAQAVQALSEKLRVVVVLFDVEGLSYQEIAEVLGCPVGTVKSRLFNARAELRRRLARYVGMDEPPVNGGGYQ